MKCDRFFILLALCALLLSGCGSGVESGYDEQGNLYGRVSISGAWAMYPLAVRWAEEFTREHPGYELISRPVGPVKGWPMPWETWLILPWYQEKYCRLKKIGVHGM